MEGETPEGQGPQTKTVTITRGEYLVKKLKSLFRRDNDNNLIIASKVKVTTPEDAAKLSHSTVIGSKIDIRTSDNPPPG